MLPVHCVPQTESLYNHRIQPALYVPQPESADHAKWTGETALVQFTTCTYHRVYNAIPLV